MTYAQDYASLRARIEEREHRALEEYRRARTSWRFMGWKGQSPTFREFLERHQSAFTVALMARARWSTLRSLLDASPPVLEKVA